MLAVSGWTIRYYDRIIAELDCRWQNPFIKFFAWIFVSAWESTGERFGIVTLDAGGEFLPC